MLRKLIRAGQVQEVCGLLWRHDDLVRDFVVGHGAGGFNNQRSREHREELGDGDFFVGAEDVAEGVADFAEGGVAFHGIVDKRHEIVFAFGGGAQGAEAAVDLGLGAIGAELFQAGGLAVRDRFVNLQNV